jgi:hypothetical protein
MEWTGYIDAYCERTAPGLLNEPLNALSNGAFFVAAWYGARRAAREGADPAQWALIAIVALVGLGSLTFHCFAARWAMLADVIPIALFTYGFLGFAVRRFFGAGWPVTLAALGALLAANLAVEVWLPPRLLNGSIMYLPALLAIITAALAARRMALPAAGLLALAAAVLAVSLVFRTVDNMACAVLPHGTHFLWHLLNGVLLGMFLAAALSFGPRVPQKN